MRFISPEKILSVIGMIKTDVTEPKRLALRIVSPQKIFWRILLKEQNFKE